jgi:OOP family OmpA-OmpF porin
MRFNLKPTVRNLALAFPALLIALPAAMSAGEDKPGPVLPPPSLYDAPQAAQPDVAPPNVYVPGTAVPAQGAPQPAAKAPEPVKPAAAGAVAAKPVATSTTAKPVATPTSSAATPTTASSAATPTTAKAAPVANPSSQATTEPWYRRWFAWLPWNQPHQAAAKAEPAKAETSMMSAPDNGGRGQYAYDSPSKTIRSGMTGQCVKTGMWSPSAATADCDPTLVAKKPSPKVLAVATQPLKTAAAGSAPAPMPVRQAKADPVEVVPLPPAPPAAKEERPLEQPQVKEETITALAEAHVEPEFDKLTLSAGALFPLSSSNIKPSGHEKLDEFVEHLQGMQFDTVRVVGYTDPTGNKATNEKLSKRRAEAVKSYLVSKGVDPKRIQTEGKGGADPLPKTTDCDALPRMDKIVCYAPDRRVEMEVVGGKPHG